MRAFDLCACPICARVRAVSEFLHIPAPCRIEFYQTVKQISVLRQKQCFQTVKTISTLCRIQFAAWQNRLPMYPNTIRRVAKPITHVPEYNSPRGKTELFLRQRNQTLIEHFLNGHKYPQLCMIPRYAALKEHRVRRSYRRVRGKLD